MNSPINWSTVNLKNDFNEEFGLISKVGMQDLPNGSVTTASSVDRFHRLISATDIPFPFRQM
jgi:hypothetical protein